MKELNRRGLKTSEPEEFIRFWGIVQNKADEREKVFFLDCGEGGDSRADGMEVCDLSGWLIPADRAEEFETEWLTDEIHEKWNKFFVFVFWKNVLNNSREPFERRT